MTTFLSFTSPSCTITTLLSPSSHFPARSVSYTARIEHVLEALGGAVVGEGDGVGSRLPGRGMRQGTVVCSDADGVAMEVKSVLQACASRRLLAASAGRTTVTN